MSQVQKTVRLVGVPMDLGAGRRGVDMGPSAIRIAGVSQGLRNLGFVVEDDGDVGVPAPETRDPGSTHARYLEPIYHVCNRLRLRVRRCGTLAAQPSGQAPDRRRVRVGRGGSYPT